MNTVDLSSFEENIVAQEKGTEVKILGLDGKPVGLSIWVVGPDSRPALESREAQAQEMFSRDSFDPPSASEVIERSIRHLACITVGWSPNPKLGGKELEFSKDNAEDLYRRIPAIRRQVDEVAGNRKRFTKGSPTD